jgi:hypothetical protein
MDSFLLNKKGLEEVSILPKNFCNMHIARRNMHIAIESILPLTHVPPAHAQQVFGPLEDTGLGRKGHPNLGHNTP